MNPRTQRIMDHEQTSHGVEAAASASPSLAWASLLPCRPDESAAPAPATSSSSRGTAWSAVSHAPATTSQGTGWSGDSETRDGEPFGEEEEDVMVDDEAAPYTDREARPGDDTPNDGSHGDGSHDDGATASLAAPQGNVPDRSDEGGVVFCKPYTCNMPTGRQASVVHGITQPFACSVAGAHRVTYKYVVFRSRDAAAVCPLGEGRSQVFCFISVFSPCFSDEFGHKVGFLSALSSGCNGIAPVFPPLLAVDVVMHNSGDVAAEG